MAAYEQLCALPYFGPSNQEPAFQEPCHSNRDFLRFDQNLLYKDGHEVSYCADASLPLPPLWAPSALRMDGQPSGSPREIEFRPFPNLYTTQKSHGLPSTCNSISQHSHCVHDPSTSVEKSKPGRIHDFQSKADEPNSQKAHACAYDVSGLTILSQTSPAKVDLTMVWQLQASNVLQGVDLLINSTDFLISLYGKCGSLQDVAIVVHKLPFRDISTWDTVISAFSLCRDNAMVLALFFEIHKDGISPSPFIFMCVLRACGDLHDLQSGRLFHDQILVRGLEEDTRIGSALVDMYAKCGSIHEASQTLELLAEGSSESWDAMITGYARHGDAASAFRIFEEMKEKGFEPRKSTFSCILKLCGEIRALEEGRFLHDWVIKSGLQHNVDISNALLTMYTKCGKLEEARHVFEDFQNRDVVSWGIMMRGYLQHGDAASVLKLFGRAQDEGTKPNKVIFLCLLNACASLGLKAQGKLIYKQIIDAKLDVDADIGSTLIDMYAKCGDLKEAHHVFDGLHVRTVVSWNAIITGYVNVDLSLVALELFERMQHEGYKPNHITFLGTLRACGKVGALGKIMSVHDLIVKGAVDSNIAVANALVDSYGKCGRLEEARHVLDKLTTRNVVSWGGMMAAYAADGDSESIKDCLYSMQQEGLQPDALIYTSALSACSHEGIVEAGVGYFKSMKQLHGLNPGIEHFNCMVDLLGDAGHFQEADELVEVMPVPPDTTTWLILLRACRKFGKVSLGRACFERIYELNYDSAAAYLLMSSIYTDACMWQDAKRVRELRERTGVWKRPGRAWIEVNDKVHEFVVGDRTHPQSKSVYAKLETLQESMKGEGYMLKASDGPCFVKEDVLCGHAERLAVAFGILSTPEGTTIRVRKNLRICCECHRAIKFVGKAERRKIFLKDAYRSHYFEHGRCSCGDRY